MVKTWSSRDLALSGPSSPLSRRGLQIVVILDEEDCRNRIAFNSLYLFSFRSIIYKANGKNVRFHARRKTLPPFSKLRPGDSACVSPPLRSKNIREAWPP